MHARDLISFIKQTACCAVLVRHGSSMHERTDWSDLTGLISYIDIIFTRSTSYSMYVDYVYGMYVWGMSESPGSRFQGQNWNWNNFASIFHLLPYLSLCASMLVRNLLSTASINYPPLSTKPYKQFTLRLPYQNEDETISAPSIVRFLSRISE